MPTLILSTVSARVTTLSPTSPLPSSSYQITRTFIGSPATATSSGRYTHSAYPIAVFAARGYAVLRCNVRGSSGYGKEFRHANRGEECDDRSSQGPSTNPWAFFLLPGRPWLWPA